MCMVASNYNLSCSSCKCFETLSLHVWVHHNSQLIVLYICTLATRQYTNSVGVASSNATENTRSPHHFRKWSHSVCNYLRSNSMRMSMFPTILVHEFDIMWCEIAYIYIPPYGHNPTLGESPHKRQHNLPPCRPRQPQQLGEQLA